LSQHDDLQQLEVLRGSQLDRMRREVDARRDVRLRRHLAVLHVEEQFLERRRLRDGRFGHPDPQAVRVRYALLERHILAEISEGATRHRRLPWLIRQIPRLVAVIDFAVLFTFCAVIFNVALAAVLSTPFGSLAALLLAVLASGVAYTWLAVTGEALKTFRGELGEILWASVGLTTWLMCAVSLVLITALSVLMYSRVVSEVISAGDDQISSATALPLGVVFAVISAVANLAVVAVHALDGSVVADEHRHAGRLLRRHERETYRHRRALVRRTGEPEDEARQGLSA
jgi:hypothetical protein